MNTELETAIRSGTAWEIECSQASRSTICLAIVADRESRVPTQKQLDTVAAGLADLTIEEIHWRKHQTRSYGAGPWLAPPQAFGLLLIFLGIPVDADRALGVLETHRDGPAELVSALRQMKDSKGEPDEN